MFALVSLASVSQQFLTEPLSSREGVLVCRITSDIGEARRVRVEAIDGSGAAIFDTGIFSLAAGATFLSSGGVDAERCRFSVEGGARGLRAHGVVVSEDGRARSLPPSLVR